VRALRPAVITAIVIGLLGTSAAGASAQSDDPESAAPVEFSGQIAVGPCIGGDVVELPGDIRRVVGASCEPSSVLEMSDPRLHGNVAVTVNYDLHRAALDGSTPQANLRYQRVDIETDEGAWRSQPNLFFAFANGYPSATTRVFVGEGAYEGLTVFAEMVVTESDFRGWDLRGYIIDGDIPAAPAPAN